jgi:D-glycero-beta-D-manno-heptose 1-phosphate adenylyltransferase
MEKIFKNLPALHSKIKEWKSCGDKIVFTNGCFDLIHLGHIAYLKEARALGSRLVVGLNSDRSVQLLKGFHRPINDEATRLAVMSSFYFVDAVIIFDHPTPLELIEYIYPDVLVKGGDWKIDQIVGSEFVLANGGHVQSLSFIDGYSTTKLENKIIDEFVKRSND